MTASTPGGPNGMEEADLRAKITEELGDAIGFLEVVDFLFLKMGLAWILVPSVIDGVGSVEIALLTIAWHKTTIHSLCVISRYVA